MAQVHHDGEDDELSSALFGALGTTCYVATSAKSGIDTALDIVREVVSEIDQACSRFRLDSDLSRVNAAAGTALDVSALFIEALQVAIDAAGRTNGLVDPTIGNAIRILGYDRTFAEIALTGPAVVSAIRVPGWQAVEIDVRRSRVKIPSTVSLDLGATAKAFAADLAAARASATICAGVLVSLGGDIAVSGEPPEDGWLVGVADSHRTPFADADEAVCVWSGGLATSSTTVRQWTRSGAKLHHLVDPSTGSSAVTPWRTVSVAASSCVEANIWTTAAIVSGDDALGMLGEHGDPARLVGHDGEVVRINGWPEPDTVSGLRSAR